MRPSLRERLRAARWMLFGRGDDAVVCSFCGADRSKRHRIVAGPGVAICDDCVNVAEWSVARHPFGQPPPGMRYETVGLIEPGTQLDAGAQGKIAQVLPTIVRAAGCELYSWGYLTGPAKSDDWLIAELVMPQTLDREEIVRVLQEAFRQQVGLPGAGAETSAADG